MAKKEIARMGIVTGGEYGNYIIYRWKDFISPMHSAYNSLYSKGDFLYLVPCEITYSALFGYSFTDINRCISLSSDNVVNYKEISTGTENADFKSVATATLVFGVGAGIMASNQKNSFHYVEVEFRSGEKSILMLYENGFSVFISSFLSKTKTQNDSTKKANSQPRVQQKSQRRNRIVINDYIDSLNADSCHVLFLDYQGAAPALYSVEIENDSSDKDNLCFNPEDSSAFVDRFGEFYHGLYLFLFQIKSNNSSETISLLSKQFHISEASVNEKMKNLPFLVTKQAQNIKELFKIINSCKDVLFCLSTKSNIKPLIAMKSNISVSATAPQYDNSQVDYVDQIRKLKELLDIGAITEDEFNTKKKQLLGI